MTGSNGYGPRHYPTAQAQLAAVRFEQERLRQLERGSLNYCLWRCRNRRLLASGKEGG